MTFWNPCRKLKMLRLVKKCLLYWKILQMVGINLSKWKKLFYHHGTSSQLLEQYKVNGLLNLVWMVDILEENSYYIQILKVWDILPLSEMPRLANRLDVLFENYTVDKMNHCKHKSLTRYAFVCIHAFQLAFNFFHDCWRCDFWSQNGELFFPPTLQPLNLWRWG